MDVLKSTTEVVRWTYRLTISPESVATKYDNGALGMLVNMTLKYDVLVYLLHGGHKNLSVEDLGRVRYNDNHESPEFSSHEGNV